MSEINEGFKYLGYFLEENSYKTVDWNWIVKKVENRINCWSFRWIFYGGRLVLDNAVLQSIIVYWFSLILIPFSVISYIRRILFQFF